MLIELIINYSLSAALQGLHMVFVIVSSVNVCRWFCVIVPGFVVEVVTFGVLHRHVPDPGLISATASGIGYKDESHE